MRLPNRVAAGKPPVGVLSPPFILWFCEFCRFCDYFFPFQNIATISTTKPAKIKMVDRVMC